MQRPEAHCESPPTSSLPLVLTGEVAQRNEDCACSDSPSVILWSENSPEKQNDCACSDNSIKLDSDSAHADSYFAPEDNLEIELPDGHRVIHSTLSATGPCVLNETAWRRYTSFKGRPQALSGDIDQALAKHRLLSPWGRKSKLIHGSPETLTSWLHVTNACNLECPYCYVRKSSECMSKEVGETALQQIFQSAHSHGFRRIKLKYAGGEALSNFELVRYLHEVAVKHSKVKEIGLSEVVLSNGFVMKPQYADWLAVSGIKLMVSIDGVGAAHDQLRHTISGRPTFLQIEKNIDAILLPKGIRPDISITVTGTNADSIANAVSWALDRDLQFSLNFYRENSQSKSRHDLILEENRIVEGMLKAYRVIESYSPTRPFLDGILDRVQIEPHQHACGVNHSYVVVTHKGELAQCQMHLDKPLGLIGDIEDVIHALHSGSIITLSSDEKVGCRDCAIRYRCAGGCPIETYRATGRWDVKNPNCNIYRTLFVEAIRLEGIRLVNLHRQSQTAGL